MKNRNCIVIVGSIAVASAIVYCAIKKETEKGRKNQQQEKTASNIDEFAVSSLIQEKTELASSIKERHTIAATVIKDSILASSKVVGDSENADSFLTIDNELNDLLSDGSK